MKLKYILGTVTIVAIVGGTIYAIKKHKDLEKATGEEITLQEAREIVKEKEQNAEEVKDEIRFTMGPIIVDGVPTSFELTDIEELDEEEMQILREGVREKASFKSSVDNEYFGKDFDEAIDDAREMADYNRSFMPPKYEDEDDIEEEIEGPSIDEYEVDDNTIGRFSEEDRTLRHEASSLDALKQYKRMELAELEYDGVSYHTMLRLFEFPFEPQNDGDHMLLTQIIDYRVQFFGFGSKWAKQVTFAEVILHYARNAVFNCDESLAYWVDYFLDFNDLFYQYSSNAIDAVVNTLNAHQYYNDERQTFGLFGLTRTSMDQAIRNASRNFDNQVTYEIEFQEFLKSVL